MDLMFIVLWFSIKLHHLACEIFSYYGPMQIQAKAAFVFKLSTALKVLYYDWQLKTYS